MPISFAHVHPRDCTPSKIPSNIHCVAVANTFVRIVLVHSRDKSAYRLRFCGKLAKLEL
jgi:hypothetical protein